MSKTCTVGTLACMQINSDTSKATPPKAKLPLSGIKVVELGQLIAGPFAARMLADFGASVIKIESCESGDPLRKWRVMHDGLSLWWEAQSRNKKSVALDLNQPEGAEIIRKLATEADVLIENFRPGTLEKWGLGWDVLHALNPSLVMLRVSGYGQDGPYSHRPGFGVVGEAMGGLRHLCAHPGEIPVRTGLSIGDSLAALHGVIGVLMALLHRERDQPRMGQQIDVALYESVFNLTESLLPEYSGLGVVREPAGSALPGIAPSNAYRCTDGIVLIAGNGDSIFRRLMQLIGRDDLAQESDLSSNDGRVARVAELDEAINAWTQQRTVMQCLETLEKAGVPAGKVYTAKDIADDPHYSARNMLVPSVTATGLTIQVPGIVPKLSRTPGAVNTAAPKLGEHTQEVLSQLGYDGLQMDALRQAGVIA
jgi:formyl-CoA transferase